MNPDNQQFKPSNNQQNYPSNNNQQQGPRVVDSVMPPYQPNQNIQPNNNYQPQASSQPQPSYPQQNNTQPNGDVNTNQAPTSFNNQKPKKKSKLIVIFIAVIAVLGLLTLAAVMLAPKSDNKSSKQDQQAQTQSSEDTTLSPAESINVEQTNSSINQDISGLNIEEDFPATQLDDKSLNL